MNPINPARSLDLRSLPTWERHSRIFVAFDQMREGMALTVITDHEPRPLRLQFERLYPDEFVWDQRHLGIARWEVSLRRALPIPDQRAFLRRCALLCDANEETVSAIDQRSIARNFNATEVIIEQDTQLPYLGLLRSGTLAAVVGAANGRDRQLFDILPGDTIGDIETIDGGRSLAHIAVTSAAAHVVLIPRGIVLSALLEDGVFARKLATICAQRVRLLGAQLSHVTQPAVSRVAAAILPYASPDAGLSPAFDALQRMTQNQLAIIAGTAKEVAARAIAELEAGGALQRTEGHIARIDRAKLQTYVVEQ
jgi:CRP/FNR family transcriptional regulator